MVVSLAVDVVDVHRKWVAQPTTKSARGAFVLQESLTQETTPDCGSRSGGCQQEQERAAVRASAKISSPRRFGPSLGAESEFGSALPVRMAFIVVRLHGCPIVAPPAIGKRAIRGSEVAARDGLHPSRVAEAEILLTLHETVPRIVVRLNLGPIESLPHGIIISEQAFESCVRIVAAAERRCEVRRG